MLFVLLLGEATILCLISVFPTQAEHSHFYVKYFDFLKMLKIHSNVYLFYLYYHEMNLLSWALTISL
jgi:hypothetical protein